MVYITQTIAWDINKQLQRLYPGIPLGEMPLTTETFAVVHNGAVHNAELGPACGFHVDGKCDNHPEFEFHAALKLVAEALNQPWARSAPTVSAWWTN